MNLYGCVKISRPNDKRLIEWGKKGEEPTIQKECDWVILDQQFFLDTR